MRREEEGARGLRKEEAGVVAEAWWKLRKKLKLQFSLKSRSKAVSRTVVVVA